MLLHNLRLRNTDWLAESCKYALLLILDCFQNIVSVINCWMLNCTVLLIFWFGRPISCDLSQGNNWMLNLQYFCKFQKSNYQIMQHLVQWSLLTIIAQSQCAKVIWVFHRFQFGAVIWLNVQELLITQLKSWVLHPVSTSLNWYKSISSAYLPSISYSVHLPILLQCHRTSYALLLYLQRQWIPSWNRKFRTWCQKYYHCLNILKRTRQVHRMLKPWKLWRDKLGATADSKIPIRMWCYFILSEDKMLFWSQTSISGTLPTVGARPLPCKSATKLYLRDVP